MTEENKDVAATAEATEKQQTQAVLQIQRIYVKDVSFEAPNLPHIFNQEWKPNLKFDLSTQAKQLADDLYEVTFPLKLHWKTVAMLLLFAKYNKRACSLSVVWKICKWRIV